LVQLLLPLRMRYISQISEVSVTHGDRLVDLYRDFQAEKIRFLMAFRHPSVTDPECLFRLLSHDVPQAARRGGVSLTQPVHSHFIYDRGIPLWAGPAVGWLYARLGGIPIKRGKVDTPSLRSIRQHFAHGRFPMAAAPEGATNGHSEIVSPIEPGMAQFGFWCAEDLEKAGRTETVWILPIGLQYQFVTPPWRALESLLSELEQASGIPPHPSLNLHDGVDPTHRQQTVLYGRLLRLGEHLLQLMEQFYTTFYHQSLTPPAAVADRRPAIAEQRDESVDGARVEELDSLDSNSTLRSRLQALLNTALSVAEEFFGMTPKGSFTERCRRIEQAAWDWIYREDLKQTDGMAPVELGLANRIAEEADLRIWHMRVVETFVSVTGYYVKEKPTAERFAETLLLVRDVVMRLKGDDPLPQPKLGQRRAHITIGEPISISDRLLDYRKNRKGAIAAFTQDLQTALESMILP
jgi:1-acyl-sn-glycerol-3-phosphate acyltransferase